MVARQNSIQRVSSSNTEMSITPEVVFPLPFFSISASFDLLDKGNACPFVRSS